MRNDYLAGLRRLSREGDPRLLAQVPANAWRWSAQVDFSTPETARPGMERTSDLVDATDAERPESTYLAGRPRPIAAENGAFSSGVPYSHSRGPCAGRWTRTFCGKGTSGCRQASRLHSPAAQGDGAETDGDASSEHRRLQVCSAARVVRGFSARTSASMSPPDSRRFGRSCTSILAWSATASCHLGVVVRTVVSASSCAGRCPMPQRRPLGWDGRPAGPGRPRRVPTGMRACAGLLRRRRPRA